MKTKILTILSKPKQIIPISAILCLILGVILYPNIGNAPKLSFTNSTNIASSSTPNSIDLSFQKSGRVESINFKKGDIVKKGDIISTLSAQDAKGVISQTKGALSLAEAQFANLNLNYSNTKSQQDVLVDSAYQNLIRTSPEATPLDSTNDFITTKYTAPTITGNYSLGKEGVITIKTFDATGGLAFNATGLVTDSKTITTNPIQIGNSGLSIQFSTATVSGLTWTITLPNTHSPSYTANKNAYDLAVVNRDKILSELSASIGNGTGTASVAKAQVDAARGAYEAALGAYQNYVITAPIDGMISSIDENLQIGQSVSSGKAVVSIIPNK